MEKLLKKGQQEDRILSAAISCALCIQLGDGESLKIFDTLKPILISLINDDSVSPSARASVSTPIRNTFYSCDNFFHKINLL